jgi:hypothetical protein
MLIPQVPGANVVIETRRFLSMTKSVAIVGSALALLTIATFVRAGSTDPVLVIGQASASGGSPSRVVDLLGSWGFDDALQIDYPLSIVVSQGSSFVRYRFGEQAVSGTFAGLADGLSLGEIAALESAGSPDAGASITRLALHEMTLSLPAIFAPGDLSVVAYVTLPGEGTFLSNTAQSSSEGGA